MTKIYRSPLSEQDVDALEALARKANAHGRINGHKPLFVCIDTGDATHQDGYLFLSWMALNSSCSHCARLIFDYITDVVAAEFGVPMAATAPQEAPDAGTR